MSDLNKEVHEGHGNNIPKGEFNFSYGSEQWFAAYLRHKSEFIKQEYRDKRSRVQFNGLLKGNLDYFRRVRAIVLLRESNASRGRALLKFPPLDSVPPDQQYLMVQEAKRLQESLKYEQEIVSRIGNNVVDSIVSGDTKLLKDLQNVSKVFQKTSGSIGELLERDFATDKRTLINEILENYERLLKKWYPNGETFSLITKAALKEACIGKAPRSNVGTAYENKEDRFDDDLKLLGLFGLPTRGVKKK